MCAGRGAGGPLTFAEMRWFYVVLLVVVPDPWPSWEIDGAVVLLVTRVTTWIGEFRGDLLRGMVSVACQEEGRLETAQADL
ncbi:hypothetical protein NDU88_007167 [Pleurodeles waltl]|uniref:Uncharacterized protein n=1 Tax=Pleurodeles waltl TaxID=8319 RepID=A0AAV7QM65_PLEWA|nr:hypothetical protein NDU88_007167 [Pleurodeles waltl]